MKLKDEMEYDHEVVQPFWTLGQLIPVVERSVHSVFPVLDSSGVLLGIVDLQEIREIMFDRSLYDELQVHEFMTLPQSVLEISTKMEKVMSEFERTEAWFLPIENKGNFEGFVSRSRLFNTYRKWLKESSLS
jgi:CIC family chloride channel protein